MNKMAQSKTTPKLAITKEDHESGIYKWNNNKCKVFLLYCNDCLMEENRRAERGTSETEINSLKESLQQYFGKDVVDFKEFRNFGTDIKTKLSKEITNADENEKYDCFIFFVLTFGVQDRIFCWDGEISIRDILEPVKKESSMALKPKVFFIQSSDERLAKKPEITKGGVCSVPVKYTIESVPREANVFILQCILPESLFPLTKDMNDCIFLTALKETMKDASTQLNIYQLSIQVIAAVEKKLQDMGKQENRETVDFNSLPIPEVTSTLTKALYFPFHSQC